MSVVSFAFASCLMSRKNPKKRLITTYYLPSGTVMCEGNTHMHAHTHIQVSDPGDSDDFGKERL